MQDFNYNWSFSNDKQRGALWYIIAISIVIGFVIWGFFSKQYIMSFLTILISGVYFFIENNSGDFTNINIDKNGINIDGSFYQYSGIEGYFFMFYNGKPQYIRIILKSKIALKYIDLGINEDILDNLKEILPNFIPELKENIDVPFTDKVIKLLKL
ncbi:MAG: hypothetical protein NWP80_01510 [Candidatus Gracilibacteria bacterium]|nr:hypothetical protein [Candidatus Gracilibacteria bacterium]